MSINVTHLPAFEYRRMRWKNGLGWTREILRVPEGGGTDAFDWRLSIAEIDHDCVFSTYPGYQRSLVLLEGQGMMLDFADGRQKLLEPPHGRADFSGDDELNCRLIDGPTRDFNLIWHPQRVAAELHHRPIVGTMVFFASNDFEWLVFQLSGWAEIKDSDQESRLSPGDCLRIAASASTRVLLEGAGELLVVRIG